MKEKHSIQNILVFLIFSIFAILSLVLVAVGIKFYTNISNRVDTNSGIRTTISYLENKIRSNDYDGGIDVVNVNGKDVLLLSNEGNSEFKTAIYVDDGKLKEYLTKGNDIQLGYGDTIANVDNMIVDKSGKNINIRIKCGDKNYYIQKSVNTGAL